MCKLLLSAVIVQGSMVMGTVFATEIMTVVTASYIFHAGLSLLSKQGTKVRDE